MALKLCKVRRLYTDEEGKNLYCNNELLDTSEELERAYALYETHPSIEHSLCVLQEEVLELQQEIYKKPSERNNDCIRAEAIQVAAMAIRLIKDANL